jgi:hypothetical protein
MESFDNQEYSTVLQTFDELGFSTKVYSYENGRYEIISEKWGIFEARWEVPGEIPENCDSIGGCLVAESSRFDHNNGVNHHYRYASFFDDGQMFAVVNTGGLWIIIYPSL